MRAARYLGFVLGILLVATALPAAGQSQAGRPRFFDKEGLTGPHVKPPPPMPSLQGPIEGSELVADLLTQARKEESPGRFTVTIEVPADAFLEVRARVVRKKGDKAGPARFIVEAGSRPLFSEQITAGGDPLRARISLAELVGKPVELRFRVEPELADGSARWQEVNLRRSVRSERQSADQGPNLLFVVVDTWRADHSSLYGYARQTTPHLDALAKTSRVYEQAISQSSWTAPAVATLFTGLYPRQHGVVHGEPLASRWQTLAERLEAEGVTTVALSANPLIEADAGYGQGFETFVHVPWSSAATMGDLFLEWLRKNRGLRWFAYLHYIDPHGPYEVPPGAERPFTDTDYQGPFRDRRALNRLARAVNFGSEAPFPVTEPDRRYLVAAYDEEIRYWDRQFGALTAALREHKLLDDTALIVTSDHGEEFADHGKYNHGHHLYEESIRVPLLVRAPGRLAPGRVEDPVELRGLGRLATQLMLSQPEDGAAGALTDLAEGRRPVFSHTKHIPRPGAPRRVELASVRYGKWKLIQWSGRKRTELYDLAADPGETADRSDRHPGPAERLRELLAGWLAADAAESPLEEPELDEERLDTLRALGYIQ